MSFSILKKKEVEDEKSEDESFQFSKVFEKKEDELESKKFNIFKPKPAVIELQDNEDVRSELVGIFGLGGAGSKITLSAYGNRL